MIMKLPENELVMIDNYRSAYGEGGYYAHAAKLPVENALAEWDVSKQNLYHLLGNQFIIKKEVTFSESEEILRDKLESNEAIGAFRRNFNECVAHGGHPELIGHRYDLMNLVSWQSLVTNKYNDITFEIKIPTEKNPYKIVSGCKSVKALGHLAKAYNIEGYEGFRLAHSMVFNQKKLKGSLCLSIHPLDFMTMSDNNSDWTSCMSWINEGEYHLGTIEMMNSPCVVIAYLESSVPMKLENSSWSNKKWRSLYVVDEHIITEIKNYPYQSDALSSEVLEWLRELVKTNWGWTQFDKPITLHNGKQAKKDDFKMTFRFKTYYMYNDFGCKDYHLCLIGKDDDKQHIIRYSGLPTCIWCGGEITTNCDRPTDCVLCENCCDDIGGTYCTCCEERIRGDIYWINDDPVCEYCYNNEGSRDAITDDTVWSADLSNLYMPLYQNKEEVIALMNSNDHEKKAEWFANVPMVNIGSVDFDVGVPRYFSKWYSFDNKRKSPWSYSGFISEDWSIVFLEDLTDRGKELFYNNADEINDAKTPRWNYNSCEEWINDIKKENEKND